MFFLGELFTNLPLALDVPTSEHCGTCTKCIDICPTQAITAPYQLDARRCISYLTIENKGAIPEQFRHAMGNRIYGCDDCQLVCPWNKYAQRATLPEFDERESLSAPTLQQLWAWNEEEFLRFTEGSAIRRVGFERWQRNLAVALGNALRGTRNAALQAALAARLESSSPLVREHIAWALSQAGSAAGPEPHCAAPIMARTAIPPASSAD